MDAAHIGYLHYELTSSNPRSSSRYVNKHITHTHTDTHACPHALVESAADRKCETIGRRRCVECAARNGSLYVHERHTCEMFSYKLWTLCGRCVHTMTMSMSRISNGCRPTWEHAFKLYIVGNFQVSPVGSRARPKHMRTITIKYVTGLGVQSPIECKPVKPNTEFTLSTPSSSPPSPPTPPQRWEFAETIERRSPKSA